MALRKAVIVEVWAIADGENTQFTLDLTKDPYWVGSHTTSGIGGSIQNWDYSLINDVLAVEGAEGMSIDGTVVTITVPLQPAGYKHVVVFNVLFDPSAVLGPPVNVNAPMVSGPSGITNAAVGDTLTCTMGEWQNMVAEPHSYEYQWWNSTAQWVSDPILGATTDTYVIEATDNSMYVFCELTAINSAGEAMIASNIIAVGTVATLNENTRPARWRRHG
jgi:hypothetical protein